MIRRLRTGPSPWLHRRARGSHHIFTRDESRDIRQSRRSRAPFRYLHRASVTITGNASAPPASDNTSCTIGRVQSSGYGLTTVTATTCVSVVASNPSPPSACATIVTFALPAAIAVTVPSESTIAISGADNEYRTEYRPGRAGFTVVRTAFFSPTASVMLVGVMVRPSSDGGGRLTATGAGAGALARWHAASMDTLTSRRRTTRRREYVWQRMMAPWKMCR